MEYSGIAVIDDQHAHLVRVINDLRRAWSEGDGQVIVMSLHEFQHYIATHFRTEETVMQRFDCFDYHNHVLAHHDFREMVTEAVDNYQKDCIIIEKLISFLEMWIVHHIETEAILFRECLGDRVKTIDQIEL